VIEEAMRLYPPVWVMEREAIEDDVVCGMPVPKGSTTGIPPWATHRLPRLWPNPETFAFAMMEMQIVLSTIVQRQRLELAPGFRLELDPSVTLRPEEGMPMVRRRHEA
jgi:cytochrome P450